MSVTTRPTITGRESSRWPGRRRAVGSPRCPGRGCRYYGDCAFLLVRGVISGCIAPQSVGLPGVPPRGHHGPRGWAGVCPVPELHHDSDISGPRPPHLSLTPIDITSGARTAGSATDGWKPRSRVANRFAILCRHILCRLIVCVYKVWEQTRAA